MINSIRRFIGVLTTIALVVSFVVLAASGDPLWLVIMIASGFATNLVWPLRQRRKK